MHSLEIIRSSIVDDNLCHLVRVSNETAIWLVKQEPAPYSHAVNLLGQYQDAYYDISDDLLLVAKLSLPI